MRNSNRALAALALLGGALAISPAAQLANFSIVGDCTGISINTSDGLTFTVGIDAGGATMTYNSTTYDVTDILGFYLLVDSGSVTASYASFHGTVNPNGVDWNDDRNNGNPQNNVIGWRTSNASTGAGVQEGETETFTFGSISPLTNITDIGLHIRVDGTFPGTGGNTGNIRFNPVPEPASLAVVGLGLFGLVRRRR